MTYRKLELSNYVSTRTRQASESDAGLLLNAKGSRYEMPKLRLLQVFIKVSRISLTFSVNAINLPRIRKGRTL